MAFGINCIVEGKDVITNVRPLNPIYAVRLYNLGSGSVSFDLPTGVGDILFTNSVSKAIVDKDIPVTASNGYGQVTSISIVGNTVTITLTSASAGYAKDLFYTFFRRRT